MANTRFGLAILEVANYKAKQAVLAEYMDSLNCWTTADVNEAIQAGEVVSVDKWFYATDLAVSRWNAFVESDRKAQQTELSRGL